MIRITIVMLLIVTQSAFAIGMGPAQDAGMEKTSADVILLVAYMLLALVFSFLCSIAEAVLLSIPPSYIEGLKLRRPRHAALLKRLKQDKVDQSLAAILTLNTIAHTVGAIGSGAKATIVFGNAWFGLFSAVMTLMILFLSEIIPKTIGAVYWSALATPAAQFIRVLIFILYPIVWISEKLTQIVSGGKATHLFSRDEFLAMTAVGVKTGQILKKESRIIKNLFRFDSLDIADIMTPRTVMTALSQEMQIKEAMELVAQTPFSRLPVYQAHIDHITGFVLKDDILISTVQEHGDQPLSTLKRDIIVVPESVTLSHLLELFLKERQHIAIVVNEHGGTEGLVTLEDIIETLMGMEIMDETDDVEDMRVLARKKWTERIKAMGLDIKDSNEFTK